MSCSFFFLDSINLVISCFCTNWSQFSDNMPRRDLGFFNWVVDTSRCKRLLENEEATFTGEAVNPLSLSYLHFLFSITYSCLRFVYAALDSDDLLYLKEQMEAEEDAERLLRRTEKRAFAAFKVSFHVLDKSTFQLKNSQYGFRLKIKIRCACLNYILLVNIVE